MGVETICDVGQDPDPVLELDPEHTVRERIENPTFDKLGRPGHERRLYPKLGTRQRHDGASRPMIPRQRWPAFHEGGSGLPPGRT